MYKISNMAAPMSHVITCIRNIEGPSVDGAFDKTISTPRPLVGTVCVGYFTDRRPESA